MNSGRKCQILDRLVQEKSGKLGYFPELINDWFNKYGLGEGLLNEYVPSK